MLPMPAASSPICIGSLYWRTNACQRGSAFAAASLLGPAMRRPAAGAGEVHRPGDLVRVKLVGVDIGQRSGDA